MDKVEERYKYEVEKDGEYEYIRSYRKHDILPNGKLVGDKPYIQVKHKYCGSIYEVEAGNFINIGQRCIKCCRKYENSFAYHVEKELKLKLEDVWDFEKNIANPYHIRRGNSTIKIWIKCQEKDYHGSYEITCANFTNGKGCSYCASKKIHPKDSFAQYHIDNTDKDFLNKYWDWDKNTVSPWGIGSSSGKKVWIRCQSEEVNELNGLMKKEYHGSYEISCTNFTRGKRCSYCNPYGNNPKVRVYDSFGYNNFNKIMSWHPDNNISPFRVSQKSDKKYKFICETCGEVFKKKVSDITSKNSWCPNCKASKGEKRIKSWLDMNNIKYAHDEEYFDDLLSDLGNPLRPDFILPDYKIWIEYDGEFHFKKMYDNDGHEAIKEHDKRKDDYAEKYGWNLVRIPYTEFDNIENILEKELNLNNKLEDK